MQHLTCARGEDGEQVAAAKVRAFLQKYEHYFVTTGHGYLGGAEGLNFQDCQLIPHLSAHAALWRRVKRTEMMAGFPQLQRWHDEMVRRESFRKTWPQGYAVEDAGKVVAEMAVEIGSRSRNSRCRTRMHYTENHRLHHRKKRRR